MLTTRLLVTEEMKSKEPIGIKTLEDFGPDTTKDENGRSFSGQHVLIESDQETLDYWLGMCDVFIVGVDEDHSAFDVYTRN